MSDGLDSSVDIDLEDLDQPLSPEIGNAEILLERLRDALASARPMPLSSSVMVQRDELIGLLDDALDQLPEELRHARRMLRERDEYLEQMRREGAELLEIARGQAERMVQRTEVVAEAKRTARRTVQAGSDEARRLISEAEDYCDQKLAGFEIVLERTLRTVRAGREKLGVANPPMPDESEETGVAGDGTGLPVFDQDAATEW